MIFNINAGQKYFFNDLKLNLPGDYNIDDFKELTEIFDDLKDEEYSIEELNLILKEIEKIASERLYDFIDAQVQEKLYKEIK